MNRLDLFLRTRSLVRDLSNSFFRENDLVSYLNEAIDRIGQLIPELRGMSYLNSHQQEVDLLPKQYQHLLAIYCASRLCTQDERHYQAGTFMNEFEIKLAQLAQEVELGDVEILDADGNLVTFERKKQYVENEYFANNNGVHKFGKKRKLPTEEEVVGGD